MDVGSAYRTSVPTYATDIWSEGLQISPLKIADRGEMRKDVLNFLLENVRYRDFIYGDLMSQIGSVKTGKKRLLELLDTWGTDTLKRFSREIIEYADRRTREELETWPDGIYESEAWVDSDGYGRTDIAIRCKLTIDGYKLSVDFEGSDPQGRGGVNAGWATCRNSVSTAILMCIDPSIPHNEGCLQHIEVKAPKGTIVNAEWPGPTAAATIVPADSITDAVWEVSRTGDPGEGRRRLRTRDAELRDNRNRPTRRRRRETLRRDPLQRQFRWGRIGSLRWLAVSGHARHRGGGCALPRSRSSSCTSRSW